MSCLRRKAAPIFPPPHPGSMSCFGPQLGEAPHSMLQGCHPVLSQASPEAAGVPLLSQGSQGRPQASCPATPRTAAAANLSGNLLHCRVKQLERVGPPLTAADCRAAAAAPAIAVAQSVSTRGLLLLLLWLLLVRLLLWWWAVVGWWCLRC